MWKFTDEICPGCGTDLTTVEPERVRWREYGECPNCSYLCPVIEVEPKPEPAPAPEPEAPPGEAPAEEPGPEVEPGEEKGGV